MSATDSPDALSRRLVSQTIDQAEAGDGPCVWDRVMNRVERALIQAAMERCGSVKLKAADFLGINRNTLNKKYNDLAIEESGQETATVS